MRILGYIFIFAGLVVAAVSQIASISTKLTFIPKNVLGLGGYLGFGLVILGIIIFAIFRDGSGKQEAEVPIYQGKKIVGYRRA